MTDFPGPTDIMFFASVGRLTIAWSHLEGGIDMMVHITHSIGGDKIESEKPRALNRKIKYLRKYFRSLPMEDGGQAPYENLFKEITRQSDFRHDIIHGIVVENATGSGEARLVRFLHKQTDVGKKTIHVDTKMIMAAASEAEKLANKTLFWVNEFFDWFEEFRKSVDAQVRP